MPTNDEDTKTDEDAWTEPEKSKLDAHYSAFLRAKFELSRRILTISSAGIGLVFTVGVNLTSPAYVVSSGLIGALAAFVMAVGAVMRSLYVDPRYVKHSIQEIRDDTTSKEVKDLNRITRSWEEAGIGFFGFGVLILFITGVSAIINSNL